VAEEHLRSLEASKETSRKRWRGVQSRDMSHEHAPQQSYENILLRVLVPANMRQDTRTTAPTHKTRNKLRA
jgi:hypothetical protein